MYEIFSLYELTSKGFGQIVLSRTVGRSLSDKLDGGPGRDTRGLLTIAWEFFSSDSQSIFSK